MAKFYSSFWLNKIPIVYKCHMKVMQERAGDTLEAKGIGNDFLSRP
jgi:hypothetical protein